MKPAVLDLDALQSGVADGSIDTVVVAVTDMQGRLQGKRIHARYFLDEVASHGTEGCNYLLAVDVEMNTVAGYEISSWEKGYGDFVLTPDFGTLRLAPWLPGSAMVQCDLSWLDGAPVRQSPRQILQAQVDEAADRLHAQRGDQVAAHGGQWLDPEEEHQHRRHQRAANDRQRHQAQKHGSPRDVLGQLT